MENIVSGSVNPFSVYTTKDLDDGGRSEEKRRYAVNSKQKLTKNLFLAGSHSAKIFPYQSMILRMGVEKIGY